MPLPLTVSCFSKIHIGFTFLVPAHPGSPGKGQLNGCVCVLVDNCRYLMRFLQRLAERSDVNKMSVSNLAIVIGPNLLWPQGDRTYAFTLSTFLTNDQLFLLLRPFNGLFSRTTWVGRYQRGNKTSLDLNEVRDDGVWGWQWHQLDHMQTICTSIQTDNHTNTSSLGFYRPDALPDAQPTVSKH